MTWIGVGVVGDTSWPHPEISANAKERRAYTGTTRPYEGTRFTEAQLSDLRTRREVAPHTLNRACRKPPSKSQ